MCRSRQDALVLVVDRPDASTVAQPREAWPSLFAIKPVQLGELPHTLNDVIAHRRVHRIVMLERGTTEPDEILAESRCDANGHGVDRSRGPQRHPRAVDWRKWHGKGIAGSGAAQERPAGVGSVRRGELFGDPRYAPRKRALRTQERGLYRRPRGQAGLVPVGSARHDLPRRDRRSGAGPPGEAPARPAGERSASGRGARAGADRRTDHYRDASRFEPQRSRKDASATICCIGST